MQLSSSCAGLIRASSFPSGKETQARDLKLTNVGAVALMNAMQHYLKAAEKMGDEKGVQTPRKRLSRASSAG